MPWGRGYNKRSREFTTCGECGDPIDLEDEEWTNCGDCQRTMCSECSKSQCDYESCLAEDTAICELCYNSCSDCEDLAFHKECLVEHLKNCNKKSRSQRALSAVEQTITNTESELAVANSQLESIQNRIGSLERRLKDAKKEKVQVEAELKVEDTANKEE
jgi:septal ring factor EnvC (AmiA/AmiB activator)